MPVRSDRLSGPDVIAAGTISEQFEVPPGETWLVKRVVVGALVVLGGGYRWAATAPGGPVEPLGGSRSIASNAGDDEEVWWALDPGARLLITNESATGTLVVWTFGAKLSGAA